MYTVTRKLELDYGHRLVGHESKCAHYHGHRGVVEVTCVADNLDHVGRVVDFGVIKSTFGAWLDDNLDHAMILRADDPAVIHLAWPNDPVMAGGELAQAQRHLDLMGAHGILALHTDGFSKSRVAIMQANPTAENLCRVLMRKARELLTQPDMDVGRIRLWETPNAYAEVM